MSDEIYNNNSNKILENSFLNLKNDFDNEFSPKVNDNFKKFIKVIDIDNLSPEK